MAFILEITVSASLDDEALLSRVLDFKEDLYRDCLQREDVLVSNPEAVDSALLPLSFSVKTKSGLARFTHVRQSSLALHRVQHAVKVVRH